MTDYELIQAYLSGDENAKAELIARHRPRLINGLTNVVGHRFAVECLADASLEWAFDRALEFSPSETTFAAFIEVIAWEVADEWISPVHQLYLRVVAKAERAIPIWCPELDELINTMMKRTLRMRSIIRRLIEAGEFKHVRDAGQMVRKMLDGEAGRIIDGPANELFAALQACDADELEAVATYIDEEIAWLEEFDKDADYEFDFKAA